MLPFPQTGRHVLRYGLQNTVIWPQDPWALPLNETFLSENLQAAGYCASSVLLRLPLLPLSLSVFLFLSL